MRVQDKDGERAQEGKTPSLVPLENGWKEEERIAVADGES